MLTLYDMELSGNCYKIRLLCALLKLEFQAISINLAQGEQKQAAFLQLNPRGQVPVLVDGETIIWDSTAILCYLAKKYAEPSWLPNEAEPLAQVMQWLAVAQNELLYGLARARAVNKFARPWPIEPCQELGKAGLAVLEAHLANHSWLANDQLTIADIACYPYVALAPEGGVSLDDSPHVLAWLKRIELLPGFVAMPGIILN